METYNPHQPDAYAQHLAELGAGRVTAAQDIRNADGVLLIKKGLSMRPDIVKRLLNHKLIQPLETAVGLDKAIDAPQLFYDVLDLLRSDKESYAVHLALNLEDPLRQASEYYSGFALINQKTTVLAARLPLEYRKALFCGWFSLALATQLGWPAHQLREAFLAGLIHDIGLFHISPELVTKTGLYTSEEWRVLQIHSLIGDMFLSYVQGLPESVRRAVREHHERYDGSGYPAALLADILGALGQIVAMADTVWALSKKPTPRKADSLADVLTITKMNVGQYPAEVHRARYYLHRHADLESHSARTRHRALKLTAIICGS